MYEEMEIESYLDLVYDERYEEDEMDANPEETSVVDYFERYAYGDISAANHSPFREWHTEAELKEIDARIREC